jgi:antitoxin component YwqK of YwqJK toxin-antitoxin module
VSHDVDYIYGKKNGIERFYYPDGSLESEIPYDAGKIYGIVKKYHPNGQLARKGKQYIDTRLAKWEWYDETGELIKTENYKRGVK